MTQLSTREKLQKFHETVQELKSTSLMKKGFSSRMKIHVDSSKKPDTSYEVEWPEDDDLRSFILIFRHFIKQEDVFLNSIFNLCHQKLTDDKMRDELAWARERWRETQKTIGINMTYRGEKQTPEHITKLWLNGIYFHQNEEKRSRLKGLSYDMMMFFKYQFLTYLVGATQIIFYADTIIERALNENLLKD
jgi:hypothetical protein